MERTVLEALSPLPLKFVYKVSEPRQADNRSEDFGEKAAYLTEARAGGFLGMAPVSNDSL